MLGGLVLITAALLVLAGVVATAPPGMCWSSCRAAHRLALGLDSPSRAATAQRDL